MTKAERIFKDTYFDCMRYIETFGELRDSNGKMAGFNALSLNDNDSVCMRTYNAIKQEIDRMERQINAWKKFGIATEKDGIRRSALEMTKSTLEYAMRS